MNGVETVVAVDSVVASDIGSVLELWRRRVLYWAFKKWRSLGEHALEDCYQDVCLTIMSRRYEVSDRGTELFGAMGWAVSAYLRDVLRFRSRRKVELAGIIGDEWVELPLFVPDFVMKDDRWGIILKFINERAKVEERAWLEEFISQAERDLVPPDPYVVCMQIGVDKSVPLLVLRGVEAVALAEGVRLPLARDGCSVRILRDLSGRRHRMYLRHERHLPKKTC